MTAETATTGPTKNGRLASSSGWPNTTEVKSQTTNRPGVAITPVSTAALSHSRPANTGKRVTHWPGEPPPDRAAEHEHAPVEEPRRKRVLAQGVERTQVRQEQQPRPPAIARPRSPGSPGRLFEKRGRRRRSAMPLETTKPARREARRSRFADGGAGRPRRPADRPRKGARDRAGRRIRPTAWPHRRPRHDRQHPRTPPPDPAAAHDLAIILAITVAGILVVVGAQRSPWPSGWPISARLHIHPHLPDLAQLAPQPSAIKLHIAAALTALGIGTFQLLGVKGTTLAPHPRLDLGRPPWGRQRSARCSSGS